MNQYLTPPAMDRQLDLLRCHADGGILLGASCLTGRYWLGSLWFYQTPQAAPSVDKCTAGVQMEAGIGDADWVDQTHVVVGLDTGGVAVWNLEDDFRTFVLSHAAAGHDGIVTSVSVVSDRTKAASSGHDRCIKMWDLSNTTLLYSSQAHSDIVSSIDCHPSEPDIFVSCGQDDKIILWDRRKPKPARILSKPAHLHTLTCARWQPRSIHRLAVGSESGQISILDTRAGVDNYLTSNPHSRPIHRLQFCPQRPSLLASVSEDCTTVVTEVSEDGLKQVYRDITHQDFVQGLAWSSESQLFTCGWDARVLSHDIARRVASVLGEGAGPAAVLVNGDTGIHGAEMGAGDRVENMDTDKLNRCKPVHSNLLHCPD